MKTRIISGIIMAVVFFTIFFLGTYFYIMPIALSILALITTNELLEIAKQDTNFAANGLLRLCVYMIVALLPWVFIFKQLAFIIVGLNILMTVGFILGKRSHVGFLGYAYMVVLLLGGALFSVSTFYQVNPYYLLFFLLVAFGSDISAYFAGYFFGKHKLIPWVSPNKTIEGAIGGVLGSMISVFIVQFLYTLVIQAKIPSIIDVTTNTGVAIAIIVFLSVSSQFGDLFFSKIKRHFNTKDYSNMLPGHGGLMDRLDGVIFVAIAFLCLTMLLPLI